MHMKTKLGHWWTGLMLIAVCSLPFRGAFAALDWLEPDLVNGHRQLWWRVLSGTLMFGVIVVAPFLIRWGARQIVRTEGFLRTPGHDVVTRTA
jgi:hypothetical protein